jgi:hypothetical protein
MPIVLTENEATESGITYEDRTGVSYQYPRMYKGLITPGERFVYYRGRRRRDGRRLPQVYFGTGVVGEVSTDAASGNRLTCRILDYRPFEMPVPFKSESGQYLEIGGQRRGYFQRGVRSLSAGEFARILESAEGTRLETVAAEPQETKPSSQLNYASPATLRAVEHFAVQVAVDELRRRYPGTQVQVLPRNNPGFDIEVKSVHETLYVEVKGTERAVAQFLATEGELQFSRRNSKCYRLIVVYRIDLTRGTYQVLWYEGPISDEAGFRLRPVQWSCELVRAHRSS